MRKCRVLPLALGLVGAALASAQARPVQPGTVVSGLSASQVEAAEQATRAQTPDVEILVSYDVGRRSYTVEVKDRWGGATGGGDAGAGPGDGGGSE